jgi:hypothetical protein
VPRRTQQQQPSLRCVRTPWVMRSRQRAVLTLAAESLQVVPAVRWDTDALHHSLGHAQVIPQLGAHLCDAHLFDQALFQPVEAVLMDPQQRMLLHVSHEALSLHRTASPATSPALTALTHGRGRRYLTQGEKFIDRTMYLKTQKEKKKGFMTGDFSKRDEFSNTTRTGQYRELLKLEVKHRQRQVAMQGDVDPEDDDIKAKLDQEAADKAARSKGVRACRLRERRRERSQP